MEIANNGERGRLAKRLKRINCVNPRAGAHSGKRAPSHKDRHG